MDKRTIESCKQLYRQAIDNSMINTEYGKAISTPYMMLAEATEIIEDLQEQLETDHAA